MLRFIGLAGLKGAAGGAIVSLPAALAWSLQRVLNTFYACWLTFHTRSQLEVGQLQPAAYCPEYRPESGTVVYVKNLCPSQARMGMKGWPKTPGPVQRM